MTQGLVEVIQRNNAYEPLLNSYSKCPAYRDWVAGRTAEQLRGSTPRGI
jgi:hypothetical protein